MVDEGVGGVGGGIGGGGDVTRSALFVFIPRALKFSKSNRQATDVT